MLNRDCQGTLPSSSEHQRRLHSFSVSSEVPDKFPSPFNITPHSLARQAAECLQGKLPILCGQHNFNAPGEGKMIGVLVVQTADQKIRFLAAFSGMLAGQWDCPGFVPPVFDQPQRNSLLGKGVTELKVLTDQINKLDHSVEYKNALAQLKQLNIQRSQALGSSARRNKEKQQQRNSQRSQLTTAEEAALISQSREDKRHHRELKQYWRQEIAVATHRVEHFATRRENLLRHRRLLSHQLQGELFDGYEISNFNSEAQSMASLFAKGQPPGGAGDCAAVKLLSYCKARQLRPLCIAEFWWGASPAGGVRHHAGFYPACRGKCGPILPYMLKGISTTRPCHEQLVNYAAEQPEIVFEDSALLIVNKPAGMLSVPGKVAIDSVERRLRQRLPDSQNPNLLVHRLDQATSGLLLAAKNAQVHKHLQQQFEHRHIDKRYSALLEGLLGRDSGEIELPLRVDLDDRPRQLVCHQYGKAALSHYRVIEKTAKTTRVEFTPVTGRTHQLRVHAAHPAGLNVPIVGDELYGNGADRLYLHAEYLAFQHPLTGVRCEFTAPVPF